MNRRVQFRSMDEIKRKYFPREFEEEASRRAGFSRIIKQIFQKYNRRRFDRRMK